MLLPLLQNNVLEGGSDVEVGVGVASLTLATNAATISYDVNVAVNSASLSLATFQADVDLDVDVSVSTSALTLATHAATVIYDVNVSANTSSLTLATYSATVDTGNVEVDVGLVGLSLQTYAATVDAADPEGFSGGYAALNAYDAELQRRRKREKERKKLLEELEEIKDEAAQEIALILHEDDAKKEAERDKERLRQLVSEVSRDRIEREFGERVAKAHKRAFEKATYSALEALVREAKRAAEEEEFLMIAVMAVH